MFDGNLGTWYVKPYGIKLKRDAEPYHGKSFPVPRIHELTLKQELDQLKALKVINKVNCSQWGSTIFLIPTKVNTIQALAVPKTRKQLRQFIGMINFYHDM